MNGSSSEELREDDTAELRTIETGEEYDSWYYHESWPELYNKIEAGDEQAVKSLISADAGLLEMQVNGLSVLEYAIFHHQFKIARYLLGNFSWPDLERASRFAKESYELSEGDAKEASRTIMFLTSFMQKYYDDPFTEDFETLIENLTKKSMNLKERDLSERARLLDTVIASLKAEKQSLDQKSYTSALGAGKVDSNLHEIFKRNCQKIIKDAKPGFEEHTDTLPFLANAVLGVVTAGIIPAVNYLATGSLGVFQTQTFVLLNSAEYRITHSTALTL